MSVVESPVQTRLKAARAKAAADKQASSAAGDGPIAVVMSPVQQRLQKARLEAAREREALRDGVVCTPAAVGDNCATDKDSCITAEETEYPQQQHQQQQQQQQQLEQPPTAGTEKGAEVGEGVVGPNVVTVVEQTSRRRKPRSGFCAVM